MRHKAKNFFLENLPKFSLIENIRWIIVSFIMIVELVVALNIVLLIFFFSVIFVIVISVCAYKWNFEFFSLVIPYNREEFSLCRNGTVISFTRTQKNKVNNFRITPVFTCLKQASIRLSGNVFLYKRENIAYFQNAFQNSSRSELLDFQHNYDL